MKMAKYANAGELRTRIKCYVEKSSYVSGEGQTTTWEPSEIFMCKWTGSYGSRVMEAQALGVNDSATIIMRYIPDLYDKLRTKRVIIIKNADTTAKKNGVPDKDNPNCYELWGGVDNIKEANQYMEFRVKRVEQI